METGSTPGPRLDIGAVIAVSWIVVAVVMTVMLGPRLGLRGWTWLGLHHVLCVLGTGDELWRARKRRIRRRRET